MSWVSQRMQQLQRQNRRRRIASWTPWLREAQRHLYEAQSREAFERGGAGAVPPGALRRELLRSLLRAEQTLDQAEPRSWTRVEKSGPAGQILLRSKALTLRVDPRGSGLLELSDKRAQRDLLDGGGASEQLFRPEDDAKGFAQGRVKPWLDLSRSLYEARVEEGKGFARAVLTHGGKRLALSKSVTLPVQGRRILFEHRIANVSGRTAEFLFAAGVTLNLKDAHVNRIGEASGVRRFELLDPAARLKIRWLFGRAARLWHFPLEEGTGRNRAYRGVWIAGVWLVKLPAGRSWKVRWELRIEEPDGRLLVEKN